jgi:FkbM family methyltransferase
LYASRFQRLLASAKAGLRRRLVEGSRHSYAQCGEDLIIDYLFTTLKVPRVRYLDIGAHHPTYLSNTYFFYERGASGICVEPDAALAGAFSRTRPRDICLNVGIGPNDGVADFYQMSTPTLNTFSREQAEKYESHGQQRIERVVPVAIHNVNRVLEEHFDSAPELLSLDVEGLDMAILQSLDFMSHRPAVFCVETLSFTEDQSETKLQEIIDWMTGRDYMLYADTYVNSIFVDNETWRRRGV